MAKIEKAIVTRPSTKFIAISFTLYKIIRLTEEEPFPRGKSLRSIQPTEYRPSCKSSLEYPPIIRTGGPLTQ